ncbi:MAG: hypothetical protein LAP86_32195 [Acidobacteriia bacterium]|nr:hypothetical protein [Terriglobia bacterium]
MPPEVLPVALKEIETRLETLISYGRDIFVLHDGARWPLWKKGGGMDTLGLDYLSDRARRWYTQRNQRSGIRQGDRIAVAGEGIAVVDQIDGTYIRAKLGNKTMLRIARNEVSWKKENLRWETEASAYDEADGNK